MIRALFVSDIHISSPEDPKCRLFLEFLDHCAFLHVENLFLVGDIFDLWIADRKYFIEAYAPIAKKLAQLKSTGTRIHYFEGNHDLDLQVFWKNQLGFEIYEGPEFFDFKGMLVRVEHGDQMDPEDRGYLFLRWLLRTPLVRWLGRVLPNFVVRWIGERASLASRSYTTGVVRSVSDAGVREKIHRHLIQVFKERRFDVLVSGHVHVTDDSVVTVGERKVRSVNLGTWLKEPMVFVVDENGQSQMMPVQDLIHLDKSSRTFISEKNDT